MDRIRDCTGLLISEILKNEKTGWSWRTWSDEAVGSRTIQIYKIMTKFASIEQKTYCCFVGRHIYHEQDCLNVSR